MKTPAFQFYPADFLSDENVVLMSNRELGCYIKLMCYCWREGSIPSDINKIGRLCNEDGSAMADLWLAIGSCFELAINDSTRLVHPRLERERLKQAEFKSERSSSGKKGAEARWGKGSSGNGSANGSAIKEPMAKNGSSSSSSSSSSSKKPPHTPPDNAGTKFDALNLDLPDCISASAWSEWIQYRKGRRLPCQEQTMRKQLAFLVEANTKGHQPDGLIDTAIRNGWQGLFEPKSPSKKNPEPVSRQARQVYQ